MIQMVSSVIGVRRLVTSRWCGTDNAGNDAASTARATRSYRPLKRRFPTPYFDVPWARG